MTSRDQGGERASVLSLSCFSRRLGVEEREFTRLELGYRVANNYEAQKAFMFWLGWVYRKVLIRRYRGHWREVPLAKTLPR